jgi:Domain of unknown function (DUF4939)
LSQAILLNPARTNPYTPLSKIFFPLFKRLTNPFLFIRSPWLNLNKPETFDGNQNNFKDFLQTVEVYMDVNHETYNSGLRKIAFVLSFMTAGAASTWKAQFIDEAYARPTPANPND